ncbi:MAG: maleylacetoacetate isomerase [Bdellovibrionales bacterium]|nr:maleylacetoacetate isomerase [Bdellovibrionales bacterium]
MTEITLYSYYRSSCAYRVRIALYLKNIPFSYKAIHLVRNGGEQYSEDFIKLNPLAQVPCLKINDKSLTQSLPIIQYLDELYPEPPLFSKDNLTKHEILSFCEIINSSIQPLQNLKMLQMISDMGGDKVKWAAEWIAQGLEKLEVILKPRAKDFSFGNHLTCADLFLIPQLYNAHRFKVNVSSFPVLAQVEKACLALPAFQNAKPESQPDAE